MNMSKRILLFIVVFAITLFAFRTNTFAGVLLDSDPCNGKAQSKCLSSSGCNWNEISGVCEKGYVLGSPCTEPDILNILHFVGYLLLIAKILVPLLIIGFATVDLFKSVVDKDEKSLTKQLKIVIIRIIIGFIVFFLPTFVLAIFNLSEDLAVDKNNKYEVCIDCVLAPTKGNCNYD